MLKFFFLLVNAQLYP